jgi:hypothetical protein
MNASLTERFWGGLHCVMDIDDDEKMTIEGRT